MGELLFIDVDKKNFIGILNRIRLIYKIHSIVVRADILLCRLSSEKKSSVEINCQ